MRRDNGAGPRTLNSAAPSLEKVQEVICNMRPHRQLSPLQDFTSPTTGAPSTNTEWALDAFSRARQWANIPFARSMVKCRDCGDRLIGAGLGLGVSVQWTIRRQRLLDFLNY